MRLCVAFNAKLALALRRQAFLRRVFSVLYFVFSAVFLLCSSLVSFLVSSCCAVMGLCGGGMPVLLAL